MSKFMKSLCKIAIPVTLQSMLQASFSIVDQIMIGQLGEYIGSRTMWKLFADFFRGDWCSEYGCGDTDRTVYWCGRYKRGLEQL